MTVTAVILSHNSVDTLREVVASVARQTVSVDRIVIVDNGSTDGTARYLETLPSSITRLVLPENRGVGAGHNAGWREAMEDSRCEYIWSLEHDTIAEDACLEKLLGLAVKYVHEGRRVAAILPRQVLPAATERTVPNGRSQLKHDHRLSPPRDPFVHRAAITFNGVLLSTVAIRATGPLREDFFVAQEDREYALRLVSTGFEIVKDPQTFVVHRNTKMRARGIVPSVPRSYYGTRNLVYIQVYVRGQHLARTRAILSCAAAALRSLVREDQKLIRIRARWVATKDGLQANLGKKDYDFLCQ